MLAVAALLLCACSTPPSAVRNVVLICFDTVRYDTFWFPELSGQPDALSTWTARATVWTHVLAPAPWTIPSVASVLTGYYPSQHGAGLFDEPVANLSEAIPSRIADGLPTVTELMREADMRTVGFSSHPWFQAGYGLKRGFRRFSLFRGAERILDKTHDWLEKRSDDPFFLYLHFMDAHDRHVQPDDLDDLLVGTPQAVVDTIVRRAPAGICADREGIMCRRYQAYALTVLDLRRRLAALLDDLEARGLLVNTAVILYADHGEEFHDHLAEAQELGVDPRGIYGFGHGQSLYQELLHVPLVAWRPDAEAGRIVDTPVSLVDITPTLLDWTGIRGASDMTGQILETNGESGALTDASLNTPWPPSERALYASGIAYGPEQFAIVRENWKYIWHEHSRSEQLFDLETDPGERHPVANDEIAAGLDEELDQYLAWYSQQHFNAPELTSEQLERLKGIGYLQGVATDDARNEKPAPELER